MKIIKIISFILVLCVLLAGCNIPGGKIVQGEDKLSRQLDIKLDGIIRMDSQIGSVIGYNLQWINSPFQIGDPPGDRVNWMNWHVMNIKLNKWRR